MDSSDRRSFLRKLSASALFLGAHGGAGFEALALTGEGQSRFVAGERREARIFALRLLTGAPLEEMAAFYGGKLGLPIETSEAGHLRVTAGATQITFVAVSESQGSPFYHFAFNIPENKILAARAWQLERSQLFITPETLRDSRYPDDVRHFRSWNAHSVFFWDPAGNVVEYIARHDLGNPAAGPFTSRDILYASEIAFVSDDVPRAASGLEAALAWPQYRSASDAFHASGDESGLLLLFKRGRELGDALRDRPAPADVFATQATIRGSKGGRYLFGDGQFELQIVGS